MLDKTLLYDWNGLNQSIFYSINSIHGDSYDMVMILLSRLADKHNVPYYLIALATWALGYYVVKKIHSQGGTNHYLAIWFATLLVLGCSFAADGLATKTLKEEFSYPRPYVAQGPQDVHVLRYDTMSEGDDYHSFPSGHASIMTVLIIGLWPVLSLNLRWVGVALIPLVCWSRMAMGMHYPADVLGGFILGLTITVIIRIVVYQILHLLKIKC